MLRAVLLMVLICIGMQAVDNKQSNKIQQRVNSLNKPLYNPFVENYILQELKQLREENRDLKIDLHKTLAQKEVQISNNVVNYATSTINNMFYIIAAATSILVIMGWNSLRDINEKFKLKIDEKTSQIVQEYEERMNVFERDLAKRARQVKQNEQEIEITNTIHSLWLRATKESTPSGKIEIYDEILTIRPDDIEAIVYKAEAVLDMGEANWSLSLTNHALQIDKNYANAYYERAKAYAVLDSEESAVADLQKAVELNEQYLEEIETEPEFQELLSKHNLIAQLKENVC